MRKRESRPAVQVFTVTGLPTSQHDDQRQRVRRYLVSMGIRTACFVMAVIVLTVLHWTVIGWFFVVGAVVLPYVAVVVANAKSSQGSTTLGPVAPIKTPNDAEAPHFSPRGPDEEPPT